MNITIDDIVTGYNTQVAELTQRLVLAEVQVKALEKRLAELGEEPTKEDA